MGHGSGGWGGIRLVVPIVTGFKMRWFRLNILTILYYTYFVIWPFYFVDKIADKIIYEACALNVLLLLFVIKRLSYYPPGYWHGLRLIFLSLVTGCGHVTFLLALVCMPFIWLASIVLSIGSLFAGTEWAGGAWLSIVRLFYKHPIMKPKTYYDPEDDR
jgi:hypothetical protein